MPNPFVEECYSERLHDRRMLLIVGSGDHARVVLDLALSAGMTVAGIVEPTAGGDVPASIGGVAVVGRLSEPERWLPEERTQFVVAIGSGRIREEIFRECCTLRLDPIALVHPTAHLLSGAITLPGAQICAGAIVGVGATVGRNAIINTAATIDHDSEIGDHATVAPGAHLAGRVFVGAGAYIGIGASVREGVRIGEWALVAAGAAVVKDVPPSVRVAGVPARRMQEPRHEK